METLKKIKSWSLTCFLIILIILVTIDVYYRIGQKENNKMTPEVKVSLGNENVVFTFGLTTSFWLDDIVNLQTGHHYLLSSAERGPPFRVKITDRVYWGAENFVLDDIKQLMREDGTKVLEFHGHIKDEENLFFNLTIRLERFSSVSKWSLSITNKGQYTITGKVYFPVLDTIKCKDDTKVYTLPILYTVTHPSPIRAIYFADFAYGETEGLFFGYIPDPSDIIPMVSINKVESSAEESCKVISEISMNIPPDGVWVIPPVVMGIHTGNYGEAMEEYSKMANKALNFCETPKWLREAGGIYGEGFNFGGGSIFLFYPTQSLNEVISSFEEISNLLEEAKKFGTNIVYLWDYWEGVPNPNNRPPYWNKGDYVPRSDLGGPELFKEGIRKLHENGGRIIVYVEPFITFKYSDVGKKHGADWAMIDASGNYYEFYPDNWAMCPVYHEWVNYITYLSKRLVEEYDVDGIFLDSYGNPWNIPCYNSSHGHAPTPEAFNRGVFNLADEVRKAIQSVKKDAVVMVESFAVPLSQHVHGSFDWPPKGELPFPSAGSLKYSAIRKILPVSVFTNGVTLLQLKSVFAAGLGLALTSYWLENSSYIKSLLELRGQYVNAFVYGAQEILDTEEENVIAYLYLGETNKVIAVLNINEYDVNATVILGNEMARTRWKDAFTNEHLTAEIQGNKTLLTIPLVGEDLRILVLQEH